MTSTGTFDEAPTLGVFVTGPVLDDREPIREVLHHGDGDWEFLCGTRDDVDDLKLVCLADVVAQFPDIEALADLPLGFRAFRGGPDIEWLREPYDDIEE